MSPLREGPGAILCAPAPVAPAFVVVDVETACSRVSSICQIGVVGFRAGQEIFAYETLVDPRDDFSPFNTRIHGIRREHVAGQPTFADIHAILDAHMAGRITVAHSFFDKVRLAPPAGSMRARPSRPRGSTACASPSAHGRNCPATG